jgi:hypothetical protein
MAGVSSTLHAIVAAVDGRWDDGGMQRKPLGEYELFKKWSGRPER